jgi:hypothetical protein
MFTINNHTCVVFTFHTVESLRRVTLHRVKSPWAKSAHIYFMFVFLTSYKQMFRNPRCQPVCLRLETSGPQFVRWGWMLHLPPLGRLVHSEVMVTNLVVRIQCYLLPTAKFPLLDLTTLVLVVVFMGVSSVRFPCSSSFIT